MIQTHLRRLLALVLVVCFAPCPPAAGAGEPPLHSSRTYLQISPDGAADLEHLFRALEDSLAADEPQAEPVIIVLHGPEALPFIRRNYPANREIVDRAARLRAFERVELRMCETWMRSNGFDRDDLLPFVDTVPLAPAEVERLERDGYLPYRPAAPRALL